MAIPGTSSGTYSFGLDNGQMVLEAFDRIQMLPPELTRHHFISARLSLNLENQRWSNKGINLWRMVQGNIPLVIGQATYTLPTNLITLTEMVYTTVDLTGAGLSTDRLMTPVTRTQYAALSMKGQNGTPTQYWFQRLLIPQITIWQPPAAGTPNYALNWWGLEQIQDAGIGSGEAPNMVYRGLDAMCACLALRLASKFKPDMLAAKKAERDEAWEAFAVTDQEQGPITFAPNLSSYGRI